MEQYSLFQTLILNLLNKVNIQLSILESSIITSGDTKMKNLKLRPANRVELGQIAKPYSSRIRVNT